MVDDALQLVWVSVLGRQDTAGPSELFCWTQLPAAAAAAASHEANGSGESAPNGSFAWRQYSKQQLGLQLMTVFIHLLVCWLFSQISDLSVSP